MIVAGLVPHELDAAMYYFAYGSNMLTRRLTAAARGPSARAIAVGKLLGRQLQFHKVGLDGSGKCDAELTECATDVVHGVLFEMSRADKLALDRLECAAGGYASQDVRIELTDDIALATTYVAQRTQRGLKPFHWYKALVVAGALEHRLPADYLAALRAVASVDDPDDERRLQHEALLGSR